MSKTAREVDHIDAIAIAIASITPLAAPIDPLHERARASLVERVLDLAGFVIVPKEATEQMLKAGEDAEFQYVGKPKPDGYRAIVLGWNAMIAAASSPPR